MITCSRVAVWLHLYLDGRLQPRHLAPLEAHLQQCAACRQELALLETVQHSLSRLQPEAEPADLTDRIMARVATAELRRMHAEARRFTLRWLDAWLALALATVSTLAFVLLNPALRVSFPVMLARSFPVVAALLGAAGPASLPWVAWIVWIIAGVLLATWFAGAEVRTLWRRSLSQRLPQLRQLW